MPNPQAQALLALANGGGHPGVADAVSPGMQAWTANNWGAVYQPGYSLPRAFETFREGLFGPLEPLQTYPIDAPEPPGGRPRARRWQYPISFNIQVGQPGTEGLMLSTFQQQIETAEQPSVPRALIESTKNDILNLIQDDLSANLVPTPLAEKAMQGNPAKRKDFESRKAEVIDFFMDPDPGGHANCFSAWLSLILEDNLVIDAVAVNPQPTRKKGAGPVGSSLGGLAYLSGDMIKPLIDMHGGKPFPPQPGYQSISWSVPRVDLMDLLADFGPETSLDDLVALNPVLESLMEDVEPYGADQLIYAVQNRRPRSVYGYSPLAQSMLAASILFARQMWQLTWFQDGSLPAVFLDPGASVATAEEARQLQEAINMLGGDLGARHQVIVLPPGAKTQPQKDVDLTAQIDEWLVALLAMSFGKSISDLGLTPKIAAMMSPQASRGAAQVASDRTTKSSTIPRAKCLKDQLFDPIIRRHLGQRDMMWSWGIEEGGESLKDKIEQGLSEVKGSVTTIDEYRINRGLEPFGEPWSTVPLAFTAAGVVPLGSDAMNALAEAPQPPIMVQPPKELPPGTGPPKPGGGKPKPAGGNGGAAAPVSDAHAGARAAEAEGGKPSGSNGSAKKSAPTMEAVKAECDVLRRYLRRGKSLDAFQPRVIPASALRAGQAVLDAEAGQNR